MPARSSKGFLSGLHRSPYYGQSVEFVQHREYVPGDDFRRIDWKVWSKTDKYYIKQYEEDTNLRTLLLVDVSESMNYGSGAMTKYDYACTVAAALSYLLLRQSDAVGADDVRQCDPLARAAAQPPEPSAFDRRGAADAEAGEQDGHRPPAGPGRRGAVAQGNGRADFGLVRRSAGRSTRA